MIIGKGSPLLAGCTVAQMVMAGALVQAELSSYRSVLAELDRRVERDKEGVDTRLGNITLDRQ